MTAPPAGALPPLPEPDFLSGNCNVGESAYTADQMREYALLAALRLREGCEGLVAKHRERAQQNREAHDNSFEDEDRAAFTAVADACDDFADDLARVLEEGE